jgi:co-chaperonin GroES (HSP10)
MDNIEQYAQAAISEIMSITQVPDGEKNQAANSLKAVKKRLICAKTQQKETTSGGIFIAGGADSESAQWAVVLSVGEEVTAPISVGDEVVPIWNSCGVIIENGEKFFVVEETNILAVRDTK